MFPLWVAFVVAIALVALGVWVYRRYFRTVSGREDRYTPERILTPEQVIMLDYLRETFPDQVVLPNLPLRNMLSIRRASDVPAAERTPIQVLRTDSKTFADTVEARRNRVDDFYKRPAGHIDLCNIPVPVR